MTDVRPVHVPAPPLDAGLFGRGMAVIRVFFGIIIFANGVSKVTGETQLDFGWYRGNLINREGARNILDFEVNRRNDRGTRVPGLKDLVNDAILPHWSVWEWVVTGLEVGVGALLILGLATRGATLLDLGQQLFLAAVYFSSNRWAFEQPHEYVPLVVLALVPAGRVWGLDALLVRARPALARWPF